MILLALDTTAGSCSVALLREGRITTHCADASGSGPPAHSRLLLPMVDALLAETGTPLSALDAIAFGAGPGSFTGLRIACGVAQGLAFALDRPVIPVDSLASIAWESGQAAAIACLDARMGEVYVAAYRIAHLPGASDGPCATVETVVAPRVCAPAAVPVPVAMPAGPGWAGCGNGFQVHAAQLAARLPGLSAIDAAAMPGARAVAALGAIALRAGQAVDAALAAPLYIRDKVALDASEQAVLRAGSRLARAAAAAGSPR
jgi:tRNA threonylcarbamoyladenosine biosynthesis protein TsaB